MTLLDAALRAAAVEDEISLHTKAAILWCDAESGGQVLETETASRLVSNVLDKQRSDGGWSLRELGPWPGWEGSDSDCCPKRTIRSDTYATEFVLLALSRNGHLLPEGSDERLENSVRWIQRELAQPYPAAPPYNTHFTNEDEMPKFRDNLYTNGGAMWAYLAIQIHQDGRAPWD